MRVFLLVVFSLYLSVAFAASEISPDDARKFPACHHCGMDRVKFSHSRMFIEYEDGSQVATCSLHCAAVELANTIDRIPVKVSVADYDNKKLIDAETAIWVMGGSKKGVMTGQAKWAFTSCEAAERFVEANGGRTATFDDAIKAAYGEMYQDTKTIREFRKMRHMKHKESGVP